MDDRPLDFPAFEFRLLTLLPSENNNAPIHCLLGYESLIEFPVYRALSYCWGDPAVTEEIFVNERSVQVGTNLKSALKELRAQRLMVLWVDALCINQKDLLERGLQVTRMGLIYSRAVEVVVWLGEEADGSGTVMSEMGGWSRNSGEFVDAPEFRHRPSRAALMALFKRPYWNRVWIIQEVSKACRLLVICGTYSVLWDDLVQYLERTSIQLPEATSLQEFRRDEMSAGRYGSTTRPSLYAALLRSRHCLASDDRDKIYAILGLSSDGVDIVPTPNYSQPPARYGYLFQEAATTVSTNLVPRWTDVSFGLPSLLVKLLSTESNDEQESVIKGYQNSIPRDENNGNGNGKRPLSISFSGMQAPIHIIDTLAGVATRFIKSPSWSNSQDCTLSLLENDLEYDSCTGRNFLFSLWRAMRADRVVWGEHSKRPISNPNRKDKKLEWEKAKTDIVIPSLAHLCLPSEWRPPIKANSSQDTFWNWLFVNQNLIYKQKTMRYWIEAYGTSKEYLDFAKSLKPGLLKRIFLPIAHPCGCMDYVNGVSSRAYATLEGIIYA